MTIGILTIATGKYYGFVPDLFKSIQEKFLPGQDKRFYLFTDKLFGVDDLEPFEGMDLYLKHAPCKGFPHDTLKRYHIFLDSDVLDDPEVDHWFYFDADMRVVDKVTVNGDLEYFFDGSVDLAVVMHSGYNWNGKPGTFEKRYASAAFVSAFQIHRATYVAGGFFGATSEAMKEMSEKIRVMVDQDEAKGIMAIWHDESYLNKYITQRHFKPLVLHPGYCYLENLINLGVEIPFHPYILALAKNLEEYQEAQ